ncbi:hypothetical protein DLD77_05355 [Chitinophaga alhagiae]|uniref:DUF4153 domain-containing protein n=1 Tax=Chitinophaga alhagiae TaxID=2203219 RepID=A0ABM6WB92_9BACT|nr:hypothetical protein [Chitinophaga alhagiae]AWO01156.1 hypothetical protein DLD77_05355 [Chitinophaga alhagiae]
MKDEILSNLNDPAQLEKLYRANKSAFKEAFSALLPELKDNSLTGFWNARLNFTREEISWGTARDLLFVIVAALVAGLIAKLPAFLHIDEELFYTRNISFIVFPALMAYFAWKNRLSAGKAAFITGAMLVGVVFINAFPADPKSDTLVLSCIHLALFLWSLLGFVFVGGALNDLEKRLGYLRYNGDLIVMTTLIVIAGAILTGVTLSLFRLIGLDIEHFYFNYIVVFGLPAAPILGTWLTQANPQLVGKVSPVIARIFSPLVLVMLVIYLVAIIYSGKDPYNDREFLLIFNALLVGVMAIIFFSVAEISKNAKNLREVWVLFPLSVVTIIVNGIALSAILFRIVEWGITPNRAAVLGGNTLMLINLVLVAVQLYKALVKKTDISGVGTVISLYLPLYFAWTIIVTFLFPLIFGFR